MCKNQACKILNTNCVIYFSLFTNNIELVVLFINIMVFTNTGFPKLFESFDFDQFSLFDQKRYRQSRPDPCY